MKKKKKKKTGWKQVLSQSPFTVEMAPGAQPQDIKLGASSRQRPSPMEPTAVDRGPCCTC